MCVGSIIILFNPYMFIYVYIANPITNVLVYIWQEEGSGTYATRLLQLKPHSLTSPTSHVTITCSNVQCIIIMNIIINNRL